MFSDKFMEAFFKNAIRLIVSGLAMFIFLVLVKWLWPSAIPYDLFQFWKISGSPIAAIMRIWPLYLWGFGASFLFSLLTRNKRSMNRDAEAIIVPGTVVSVWAGVAEEIYFRWLLFLTIIVTTQFFDWLFLGFLGIHLIQWLYSGLLCPVANFFTLGYLEPYLFSKSGWYVGAAIISSNFQFREGHKYQGPIGYVNSWFLGMCFFWLMFNYGLIVAMFAHFLYNFLIFSVRYGDAVVERKLGWV